MLELGQHDIRVDWQALEAAAPTIQARGCVTLQRAISTDLQAMVLPRLRAGTWEPLEHQGIGHEEVLRDPYLTRLLYFTMNNDLMFEAITRLTRRRPTWFDGRVYRLVPGSSHHDTWHSDASPGRLVGFSLNLSEQPYAGGDFEMRRREGPLLARLAPAGVGSASLFLIDPTLQHRVAPVEGRAPRVAFAGWFRDGVPSPRERMGKQ